MSEEILSGLRSAMSRGDTLQEAMQSFYNAGYLKKDIDAAARKLQSQINSEPIIKAQEKKTENVKKSLPVVNPKKEEKSNVKIEPDLKGPKTVQKASDYDTSGEVKKNPKKKMILLISILLGIILIILGGIYLFRETLLEIFTGFLG